MAGDWIKMETCLGEKPEVLMLSERCALPVFDVIGRLHKLWSWLNQQSRDGHALSVTLVTLDKIVCHEGFATQLRLVGWLDGEDGNLSFPNFDRHNGQSAKNRATAAVRKQRERERKPSRGKRDRSVTREEKRREDINTPKVPKGTIYPDDFKEFWEAYPKKSGKDAALRAWKKRKSDLPALEQLISIVERHAASEQWTRDSGKFIPNPTTWLNEGRWADEMPASVSQWPDGGPCGYNSV